MKLNLIGQRFGRWTVIEPAENKNGLTMWLCRCDCGTEKTVRTSHLKSGRSKSCGCHQYDHLRNKPGNYPEEVRIKRLYRIWKNILRRCQSNNYPGYKNYGGRGIIVCEDWNDYVLFARWALDHGYSKDLTIDRIDINGNYTPDNCRWVTMLEQSHNKRNNRLETINGVTKTVAEWSREYDIESNTLLRRLNKGMSITEAISKKTHCRNKYGIPVKCVDTGEVFASATNAAQKYGITGSHITAAIRTGKTARGMRWEYMYD